MIFPACQMENFAILLQSIGQIFPLFHNCNSNKFLIPPPPLFKCSTDGFCIFFKLRLISKFRDISFEQISKFLQLFLEIDWRKSRVLSTTDGWISKFLQTIHWLILWFFNWKQNANFVIFSLCCGHILELFLATNWRKWITFCSWLFIKFCMLFPQFIEEFHNLFSMTDWQIPQVFLTTKSIIFTMFLNEQLEKKFEIFFLQLLSDKFSKIILS